MSADDILKWIAIKSVDIGEILMKEKDRSLRIDAIARKEILEELRRYILMKTNPHNREDIRRFNERNDGI